MVCVLEGLIARALSRASILWFTEEESVAINNHASSRQSSFCVACCARRRALRVSLFSAQALALFNNSMASLNSFCSNTVAYIFLLFSNSLMNFSLFAERAVFPLDVFRIHLGPTTLT